MQSLPPAPAPVPNLTASVMPKPKTHSSARGCEAALARLGFRETPPDADGSYGGCIIPPAQYWFIFRLAFISFIAGSVAAARGHWDLCMVPYGVGITSLLYWWRPDYSWRRYVDIVYVQCALWYQTWRAIGAENAAAHFALTFVGIVFFPIGVYAYQKYRLTWLSTLCHSMVHVFCTAGNIALYMGSVRPIQ
jgi:hypothetical protein